MLKMAYTSLDEVPEAVRSLCVAENGVVSLDESKLKTQADVDAVLEGKRKEVADHGATKAKLAEWQKLGESPEKVQALLSDLQSRTGDATEQTEKIAALQREKNRLTSDFDALKANYEKIQPEYATMKKQLHEAKVFEVLESSVSKLQGVDAPRLTRALRKDVALGLIDLDESGEGLTVKTGETFATYAMAQANDFNFKVANTPGQSNPGSPKIPEGFQQNAGVNIGVGIFDKETREQLAK